MNKKLLLHLRFWLLSLFALVVAHSNLQAQTSSNASINKKRCGEPGTILIGYPGLPLLTYNDFSTAIASPYAVTHNALISNGQVELTSATNSQQGALIFTPTSSPPNGLIISFDMDIFSNQAAGNSIADGMSFNFGLIPGLPTGNFEDGIVALNTGLVVRFKTWQTQRVEIVYNGVVKGTYDADIHHPTIRKVQLAVTSSGLFSMRIGDKVICTNVNLSTTYGSDGKSTWKMAWAARTGGSNNRHAIDNIYIVNNLGVQFSIDNWTSQTPLPYFTVPTGGNYTVHSGHQFNSSLIGNLGINFNVHDFTTVSNAVNSNCNGRTITVSNTLTTDTLIWSDFASRPTLSNFNDLGNATFSNGSVQLTDNTGSQNGRIVFPQTPNAGVFTATFKARVWDGNNADGFSFNYGQIDNVGGADGGMMNTNTPGLSVCFPTWNTNNIIVKYKNNVLTTVPNTGSGGNRASFFTPIEVSVNTQYQLTVKWNGTTYISNYDLVANSTYETDAKTNWQFAWGARTGGQFDRHQLDDILVTGKTGLLYSYDGGTTFETNASKTIAGTQAVNVVVKTDGVCTPSTTSLAALVIPTFTPIAPICSGNIINLPTTSNNGITGTWAPAVNNLTTTTYTFTPSGGGCTATLTVSVTATSPTITSVTASSDTICHGLSTSLYALPTGIGGIQVSTLAGSTHGYADGTGTAALFSLPSAVATDANGNVYVADQSNHRIRKITPAGVVTTFAGSGIEGYADGTGTTASFNYPSGVATDANGNVFVADLGNHRIRKITPAGVVTTVAGSGMVGSTNATGIAASFHYPNGIATDASGNLYVADEGNHRIRKITSSGVVTTLAGNGISGFADGPGSSAQFHNPYGVATDASGNVYVADYANHRIRKITSGGVVSTLAGNGTDGFANGIGAAASFNYPTNLATDAVGNVYVADYLNHRIRKITPAGVVTTYAGSGIIGNANGAGKTAMFTGTTGVAIDPSGNIYVADYFNRRIRKINITAPVTYNWSQSVTGVNASMDSVLTTPNSSTVYTVTATNASGCTASSTINVVVKPNYIIAASAGTNGNISPSGNTTVCQGNNQTYTITADANYHIADVLVDGVSIGTVASYTFSNVTTAHTISASFAMNCVTTYDTLNESICQGSSYIFNGNPQSIAGTYLDTIQNVGGCDSVITLNLTILATSTSTTNLTICSYDLPYTWNGLTFTVAGTQIAHFTNSVGCDSAAALNLNVSLPNLEISSLPVTSPYMVSTIAGTGSFGLVNGPGATAQFFTPMGVAIDSVGNIYVGDATNNRIRMISPSHVVSTYAGAGFGTADGPINTAQFNSPTAVVFDKFGNLFVSDQNSHKIRKITPSGIVSTLAGAGFAGFANGTGASAQFNLPTGLATDTNGNVYVADLLNNRIRKITPAGVVTTYAGTGVSGTLDGPANTAQFATPTGIAMDKNGNLFVTGGDRIRKITPSGTVSTLAGGSYGGADGLGSAAQFSSPQYLTTDALGNIYAPEFGGRIRKITPEGLVSTIASGFGFADGSATTAKFNAPTGIAIDLSGNIILSDRNNNRIRKITKGNYSMTICDGSSVILNGTGSTNYSWAGPQAITNGVAFNAITSGVYTVTATDTVGCVYTNSIAVVVNPTFTINASAGANGDISPVGNTAVCQGDNQTYTITPDANYQVADVLVDGISVGAVYSYTFTNVTTAHTINASFVLSCVPSSTVNSATACYAYTWPVNNTNYTTSGVYTFTTGCHTDSLLLTIQACKDLKVLIQGYYLNSANMQPVLLNSGISATATQCDTISVELHDASAPYATAYSFQGVLNTDGTTACTYPEAVIGNSYYIVVKHRNSIETWSAAPELFQTATTTYDFSSAAHQAYGSNQIQLSPTEWGMYSGDVNQDLFVDVFDYLILDGDLVLGITGYAVTDITGDGAVDTFDYLILDGNIINGVGVVMP